MTWIGEQLPIDVNSRYSINLTTDTKAIPSVDGRAEVEATGHWLFGTDFPDLDDLIAGQKLQQHIATGTLTGGSGYTYATVAVSGGGGSGASGVTRITNGVVDRAALNRFGEGYWFDPTATILGDGTGASLADMTLGPLPLLGPNYMLPGGITNAGLHTPVIDQQVQTICGIFQFDPTDTADLMSAWPSSSSPFVGGFLLWWNGTRFQTNTTVNFNGAPSTGNRGIDNPGYVAGDWYMAVVRHAAVETVFLSKAGSWGAKVVTNNLPRWPNTPADRTVDIGGVAGHPLALKCAEFMTFDYALSDAELDDLLARSTARMAARGIALA